MVSRVLLLAVGAATALGFAAGDASASERYRQRPPVVVSPDLAAPWVMQLEGQGRAVQPLARPPAPRVVRRGWFQAVQRRRLQLRRAYRQQRPAGLQTAGIAAPVPQEVHPPLDPRYLPQDVVYEGSAGARHDHHRYARELPLSGEGRRQARRYGVGTGKPGFEWAGTHQHHPEARVAGLAPAGRDDRARAPEGPHPARPHGGRPGQPARRARALSGLDALPHPRDQPALDDRWRRLLGLHPHAQRGRRRPLRDGSTSEPRSW